MIATQDDTIILVKHAQAGNIEAFDILMQNHEREIFGYLVSFLGDRDEALDFVQQVFLKAWLNLVQLKDAACFKSWLYRIARNMLLDYWRGKKNCCQSWEHTEPKQSFTAGPLTINFEQRRVIVQGQEIVMTYTEYKLLSILVENVGSIVTYDYILSHVWREEDTTAREYIHVYVNRLRKKIETPAQRRFIYNEPKVGYRFQADE